MKRLSAFALATIALTVSACASGGGAAAPAPEPQPLDPVGTYSFESSYQGQAITGQIIIRGTPGNYSGSVEPMEGPPPVEIYSVRVEGQQITVFGDAGGEDLVITMNFTGGTYTGTWVLGFDSGELTGERLKQ